MPVKVCACSLCGSHFSSRARRPRCPRCGGWGRVVEEAPSAAKAAEKVRELQAAEAEEVRAPRPLHPPLSAPRLQAAEAEEVRGLQATRKLKGMSKLKSYVEKLGGVATEEELAEAFDEEWLRKALEELEARGVVAKVGGKLVFREA